jgi:hypothetical protein
MLPSKVKGYQGLKLAWVPPLAFLALLMGDRVGIEMASVPIDQPVREMYSWGIFEGVAVLY